ncbi:DUF362 domain-containing protein [Candidatus Bathyarchaeota archaeon]|nr:DUF362 domain-containing protein [Candidatus Bathyarchaeota archaeon]
MMAEVSITKGEDIVVRTREAVELLGGVHKVVGKGDKVFIKPNIVDGAPFITGEVVQLETIRVLVEECFCAGASEVLIGETPTYRRQTETILQYKKLADEMGAKFLELNNYPFVEVNVENPRFFKKVRLSKPLLESDVFINVPTLKTHASCGITVSIKNMYGLIPPEDRVLYHTLNRVEEAIVDLYKAKRADLIVVDGTYTTFHLGPRPIEDFKETFRLNLTLAGFDPVAIDTISAKILGINPSSLRYLKWAEEDGLGTRDINRIRILGVSLEEACFGRAAGTADFINNRMNELKVMNFNACTGCLQAAVHLMHVVRGLRNIMGGDRRIICVIGPEAKVDFIGKELRGENDVILLCGYCVAPTFYNCLSGVFIPGCPPQPEDLQRTLKELLSRQS